MSDSKIPVIDLSQMSDGSSIRHAYTKVGFAELINHDIPQSIIDNAFKASRQFHAMRPEGKMKIACQIDHRIRGYLPNNSSTLKASTLGSATKPNNSESFIALSENIPEQFQQGALSGKNKWPANLPNFKSAITDYCNAINQLGKQILPYFALALGLPKDCLNHYYDNPFMILRLLYYPAAPNAQADEFGSAPHTDYGLLTFLVQDDLGGLEVKSTEGEWIAVPPQKGSFILNTGNMMRILSNGQFLSTPHRVRNTNNQARFSIPLFLDPPLDAVIEPIPELIPTGEKGRFSATKYGDNLAETIRKNYKL